MKKTRTSKTTPMTPDQELEEYRREQEANLALQRKALSEVPVGTIGMIAATLSRPGITAEESVKKAYEILEWATFGQLWLAGKSDSSCYGTGVIGAIDFNLPPDFPEDLIAEMEAFNALRIEDENGETTGLHFDKSLKFVLPKLKKEGDRLQRFRRWLNETHRLDIGKVGDLIAVWKKQGIPESVIQEFFRGYKDWWVISERTRKSRNQKKRRANEGKLKRKARPPIEKLRDIGRLLDGEKPRT